MKTKYAVRQSDVVLWMRDYRAGLREFIENSPKINGRRLRSEEIADVRREASRVSEWIRSNTIIYQLPDPAYNVTPSGLIELETIERFR